jgi:hypothetical protein
MTGHKNVMLVLQSCTDSVQVLPGSSSETFPTSSDGTCDVSNTAVQQDVVIVEERFIAVNKEVPTGIKQEQIPEDISFAAIKAEPNEVSYVCVYVCYYTHFTRFFLGLCFRASSVTQIKHPTRCCNQSQNLLLCRTDAAQHVSGITMPIIRSQSNCRCSLWFPYECGVEMFLAVVGLLVTDKPITAENTSTSTFIRKPEAATAV